MAIKDLSSKLAEKMPKPQGRDDSDDYTDDERPESDREAPPLIDQVDKVNQARNSNSSSQRERTYLQ